MTAIVQPVRPIGIEGPTFLNKDESEKPDINFKNIEHQVKKISSSHSFSSNCHNHNRHTLDMEHEETGPKDEPTKETKSNTSFIKVIEDNASSVTGTEYEQDINTLISVTIKEHTEAIKAKYSATPRSVLLKHKEEEPGQDEIYCLKEGYKLGKKIGEGAYSKVKSAEVLPDKIKNDKKIARLVENNGHNMVAVKILNKQKAPSDYTTKFIGREIQALHRIRGHPNVVEIYDVFETNEFLFIITELCQKGDLFHYINAHTEAGHSGLSENQSRGFFVKICEGMQYCHGRGVVHRDFKCDNVLICDDEKTVKITDFGFACTVPNKRLMLSTPCGSYSYAAPEVLFGKSYDPFLSDIWCLGVVLFCMLNGTTPYGHVQLSMLANHMKAQRLQFQKISQEAKLLLRKMLQYDPRKRPRLQEILNSPWVNKEKVNIVERLYTPTVIDRSHLTGMVTKFNIPTTSSQSTEHRQCINFSRISFGNGSESVLLKSRQPNRERDRYLLVRPVLRRTRMSVVEFKERLGLKINQTRPMAEILKNIITGLGTKTSSGAGGDDLMEYKIPELPGTLSNVHGDSNQHMIEYLAEMWVDIDRDRGTTVTEHTTCTGASEHANEGGPGASVVKPKTAPAAIAGSNNSTTMLQRIVSEKFPENDMNNVVSQANTVEQQPDTDQIVAVEDQIQMEDPIVNGLHPPPGRECCCCGGSGQPGTYVVDEDENGTEVSFCTCSNPDTLHTGSTYTVHVPQPQDECLESPPPEACRKEEPNEIHYSTHIGEQRVANNTPVDGNSWNPPPPSWREVTNLYRNRQQSLTESDRGPMTTERAERILARARLRNSSALYDASMFKLNNTPGADLLREQSQLLPSTDNKPSSRKNVYSRPRKQGLKTLPNQNHTNYKMNIASVKMSVVRSPSPVTDQPSQGRAPTPKQCFALLSYQAVQKIIASKCEENMSLPPKTSPSSRYQNFKAIVRSHSDRKVYKADRAVNRYEPYNQYHHTVLEKELGSILKYASNPPSIADPMSAIDGKSEMGSFCEIVTQTSNKTYLVNRKSGENDNEEEPNYNVPEIGEEMKDLNDNIEYQNVVNRVNSVDQTDKEEIVKQLTELSDNHNIEEIQDILCLNDDVKQSVACYYGDDSPVDDIIVTEDKEEVVQHTTGADQQQNYTPDLHYSVKKEQADGSHQNDIDGQHDRLQGLNDNVDDDGGAELDQRESDDSLRSSADEELTMVAEMDELGDEVTPPETPFTPTDTPKSPAEVKHFVTPVRLEAKSVSPIKHERLYFLKPKRTESEKSEIYDRHARATPVKERYLSAEVLAEIKKSKKLISKKGAYTSNALTTNSGYTMMHLQKSSRKSAKKSQRITTDNSRLTDKTTSIDRDNRSLPLLQVHRSRVSRPVIYEDTRGRPTYRLCEPKRALRPRSRSPFPNPLSNPTLWQQSPESLQLGTDLRSTPSITCPMLPQKIHNMKEVSKRRFRQRTPDIDIYHFTEEKKSSLFPPVQNLVLVEDKKCVRSSMIATLQKQY